MVLSQLRCSITSAITSYHSGPLLLPPVGLQSHSPISLLRTSPPVPLGYAAVPFIFPYPSLLQSHPAIGLSSSSLLCLSSVPYSIISHPIIGIYSSLAAYACSSYIPPLPKFIWHSSLLPELIGHLNIGFH